LIPLYIYIDKHCKQLEEAAHQASRHFILLIRQINTGFIRVIIQQPLAQPLHRIQTNRLHFAQLNKSSDQHSIALGDGSLGLLGTHRRLWYRNEIIRRLKQKRFTQGLQNQGINKLVQLRIRSIVSSGLKLRCRNNNIDHNKTHKSTIQAK